MYLNKINSLGIDSHNTVSYSRFAKPHDAVQHALISRCATRFASLKFSPASRQTEPAPIEPIGQSLLRGQRGACPRAHRRTAFNADVLALQPQMDRVDGH